jgi:hypothetical protein
MNETSNRDEAPAADTPSSKRTKREHDELEPAPDLSARDESQTTPDAKRSHVKLQTMHKRVDVDDDVDDDECDHPHHGRQDPFTAAFEAEFKRRFGKECILDVTNESRKHGHDASALHKQIVNVRSIYPVMITNNIDSYVERERAPVLKKPTLLDLLLEIALNLHEEVGMHGTLEHIEILLIWASPESVSQGGHRAPSPCHHPPRATA